MGTNSSISNFRKLPWPFIASLLLFFLLQIGLEQCPAFWRYVERNCRFHYDDALLFESILRRIPRDAPFKKVLIIGTSQPGEDIDYRYLNDYFNQQNIHFYDLTIPGSFFPIDLFMLKDRILATNPDVIVYSPFVESFYTTYKKQPVNNLEYFFNPTIIPYLGKHLQRKDYDYDFLEDFLDVFVSSVAPGYRFRKQFGNVFFDSLQYSLGVKKRPPPKDSFFTERLPDSYFEEQIKEFQIQDPAFRRFRYTRYTDLNQELFSNIAQEFVAKNIKFIVTSCPVHPLFLKVCAVEIWKSYTDFLKKQSREIGFSYGAYEDLPSFTAEEFNDFSHLTPAGRARFTEFLIGYFEREFKDFYRKDNK